VHCLPVSLQVWGCCLRAGVCRPVWKAGAPGAEGRLLALWVKTVAGVDGRASHTSSWAGTVCNLQDHHGY
jgi:hypothetical protein